MSTEAAFLAQIRANPNDDVVRLVFSDWLEEQGDVRAEVVRLGCQVHHLHRFTLERRQTEEAVAAWYQTHVPGWPMPQLEKFPTEETVQTALPWRLAETIAWCAGRKDHWRSWRMDPRALIGMHWMRTCFRVNRLADWRDMVYHLTLSRLGLLAREGIVIHQPVMDPVPGRVLVLDPRVAYEGKQEPVGFFDENSDAAWGAWVMVRGIQMSDTPPDVSLTVWVPE